MDFDFLLILLSFLSDSKKSVKLNRFPLSMVFGVTLYVRTLVKFTLLHANIQLFLYILSSNRQIFR